MPIRLKRIYDPAEPEDGFRLLVMRLWPRGVRKEEVSAWEKDSVRAASSSPITRRGAPTGGSTAGATRRDEGAPGAPRRLGRSLRGGDGDPHLHLPRTPASARSLLKEILEQRLF